LIIAGALALASCAPQPNGVVGYLALRGITQVKLGQSYICDPGPTAGTHQSGWPFAGILNGRPVTGTVCYGVIAPKLTIDPPSGRVI
jgi:hypothetical protein